MVEDEAHIHGVFLAVEGEGFFGESKHFVLVAALLSHSHCIVVDLLLVVAFGFRLHEGVVCLVEFIHLPCCQTGVVEDFADFLVGGHHAGGHPVEAFELLVYLGDFGECAVNHPSVVCALVVVGVVEEHAAGAVVAGVVNEGVDHVLGELGLYFSLLVGDGVEGEGLHEIVVAVNEHFAHARGVGGVVLRRLNLRVFIEFVVLFEGHFARHVVCFGILRGFGVGECRSNHCDDFGVGFALTVGVLCFLHQRSLCGGAECGAGANSCQ